MFGLRALLGAYYFPAIIAGALAFAGVAYYTIYNSGYDAGVYKTTSEYEEAERKRQLERLSRRDEAEKVLGEREAAISHKERQQRDQEAQARLNAANSTNQERNVFLERSRQIQQEQIRALESIIENYADLPKDKRTKVITEYVKTFKSKDPVFSGDTKPSTGFLREYERLNNQAREIESRALSTTR